MNSLQPQFSKPLLDWYQEHKRALPWRKTKDPYAIWVSEVILQQTRVKQGLPYYERFMDKYPRVQNLAEASEDQLLRLWQGLGYYSRARNMHQTARYIWQELGGDFPDSYAALLKLKGVGPYTAAAIASFAYNETVAVVDGNVYRVLSRYFGIEKDINYPANQKEFKTLAQSLVPEGQAQAYNQAIMEFGAIQCTIHKPNCLFCPIQEKCEALARGLQDKLPIKISRTKIKKRFFHYLIVQQQGRFLLKKRSNEDIWGGLYDFVMLESKAPEELASLLSRLDARLLDALRILGSQGPYKHVLTHQRIQAWFWKVELKKDIEPGFFDQVMGANHHLYNPEEIRDLPKPILIEKYLQQYIF